MTIHELLYEIKSMRDRCNTREAYIILLVIVVGFASFGLGRLSKLEETRSQIRIEQTLSPQAASAAVASPLTRGARPSAAGEVSPSVKDEGLKMKDFPAVPSAGGQFVASKTGAKYHFPWCAGAQRIAEANKLWFNSVEEARNAGYTPASNCKGLR